MDEEILQMLGPAKKERLNEVIVSQIKGLIFSNKVGVGKKLPSERQLAARFNVSRVVVRESLRSLEQSGLIEIRPGAVGGPFVAYNVHKPLFHSAYDLMNEGKLTLHHFFEARRAVECFSTRLAVLNATDKDMEGLKAINQKLIDEIGDKARLRENNTAFHVAIAEISRNPLIKLIVQSLLEILNTIYPHSNQSSEFIRGTYERHQAIIGAMEKKDPELSERMMALDTEHTAKLSVKGPEDRAGNRSRGRHR